MTQASKNHSGFTLIELMIVIAIIGILASIAAPQYNTYNKRSRFTEVVLATNIFTTAAEVAISTGRASSLAELNAGANGIPATITSSTAVGTYVANVTVVSGVITATGTSDVDNATYKLSAQLINDGIRWAEDDTDANSCQKQGLC